MPIDNKTAPKEWSSSPRFGEHAKRSDPVEVSFTDGSIYYVPSFTVGQLAALNSSQNKGCKELLWEGTHVVTNNVLTLSQRVDNPNLLLSFVEQGKQKLQVIVNKFGELGEGQPCRVDNGHPAVQAAKDFIMPLVLRYQRGEVETEELKDEKDPTTKYNDEIDDEIDEK